MRDLFSPMEDRVLKILGRKKMKIVEITEEMNADNNVIAGTVRRINLKCERHDLPWFLNGQGLGRSGKTVWKDKR